MRTTTMLTMRVSPASTSAPPARPPRARRRRFALLLAALVVGALCTESRPAAALDNILPGQEAAFVIDGALGVGSVVSIVGNAVTLAQNRPQRSWMYSGFVLGWINTVIAPLLMVYGREPDPNLGLGLGAAHMVIGVTNLALAIRNGVIWHRQRVAERNAILPPPAPPAPPAVSIAPVIGRDGLGGSLYGVSLQLSRF